MGIESHDLGVHMSMTLEFVNISSLNVVVLQRLLDLKANNATMDSFVKRDNVRKRVADISHTDKNKLEFQMWDRPSVDMIFVS